MTSMIGQHWKHKKRGPTYEILHDNASLQCATAEEFEQQFEDEDWIIYRNTATGSINVRLREEFLDGRFEKIKDAE
jgi:hypothetical protein